MDADVTRRKKLVAKLVALIDEQKPIGLLTHHLVHDENAWEFLDRALSRLASHTAARFKSADDLRKSSVATS